MRLREWFDTALAGDLVCLLLAAPPLYFPNWFPTWAPFVAFGLLIAGWLWRRWRLGIWLVRTPADWPIFFLFCVMLPISVWVAPPELRERYSTPRAYILIWNFCLFWTIVTHSGRSSSLRSLFAGGFVAAGTLIAVAAVFGTQWVSKFPVLSPVLGSLPHPLVGVFQGAESGFSPNQLAGTLLYVLPFLLALWFIEMSGRQRPIRLLASSLAALLMGLVFIAVQSRAGIAGMVVSLAVLLLAPWRLGRWLLAGGTVIVLATMLLLPIQPLLLQVDATTRVDSVEGGINMAGRFEIWSRALYGISDFPFTGMGLGTFRAIVQVLYPLFTISPADDIAHAHNFFLQGALDFGLPGLVALLAIYLVAIVQCINVRRNTAFPHSGAWAVGMVAALSGQAVYSLADAVAIGSKTNFFFWYLLALILGVSVAEPTAGVPSAEKVGE